MRDFLLACCVVTVWALYPGQVNANEGDSGACKADIAKFCKGTKGHEMGQCLHEHESELSDPCKTHMAAMKAKMSEKKEEVMAACKGDAEKLCADVKPGGGGIRKCLHDHMSEVSDTCKTAMHAGHEGMKHK